MSLEDKFITFVELYQLADGFEKLTSPRLKTSVTHIGKEYYVVKDQTEDGVQLGSQIRLDPDVGYNFRKDENGMFMRKDELLGLTILNKLRTKSIKP